MLWVAGSVLVAYTITYSEELCMPRKMVYGEQNIAGAMYMLFLPHLRMLYGRTDVHLSDKYFVLFWTAKKKCGAEEKLAEQR